MRTTWHVNLEDGDEMTEEMSEMLYMEETPGMQEGHPLIVNAAKRVWEELYACKKPVSVIISL